MCAHCGTSSCAPNTTPVCDSCCMSATRSQPRWVLATWECWKNAATQLGEMSRRTCTKDISAHSLWINVSSRDDAVVTGYSASKRYNAKQTSRTEYLLRYRLIAV